MISKFSKIFFLSTLSLVGWCYGQDNKIEENIKSVPIDLKHWSVTVPHEDSINSGKPLSIGFPEIMDYASNPGINKYMYNDADGALVFYAYPSGITTANTHYSRSELREQMVPGKTEHNWTFDDGGNLKGTLAMDEVSKDANGKYHKVIIMQIHGRLSDAQKDLIGEDDNNAPPILKIYWDKGKIRVKTKVLKNPNASDAEILSVKAWGDDKGFNFNEKVDFEKFTLEIKVSKGRLEVILNNNESVVYNSPDLKKWSIFENYFKAGNYLQTNDEGAFAKVKYYSLEASH